MLVGNRVGLAPDSEHQQPLALFLNSRLWEQESYVHMAVSILLLCPYLAAAQTLTELAVSGCEDNHVSGVCLQPYDYRVQ